MTNLLAFLNIAVAFLYNLISIIFTPVGWVLKLVGILCTAGADGLLNLLENMGQEIYANQLNAKDTNTKRT